MASIYSGEYSVAKVRAYDDDGTPQWTIDLAGDFIASIRHNTNDILYVLHRKADSSYELLLLDPSDGSTNDTLTLDANTRCFDVDKSGNIYVSLNTDVRKYNSSLVQQWLTTHSYTPSVYNNGCAIDKDGNFYIAANVEHKIVQFESDGTAGWVYTGDDDPHCVVTDDNGNVYSSWRTVSGSRSNARHDPTDGTTDWSIIKSGADNYNTLSVDYDYAYTTENPYMYRLDLTDGSTDAAKNIGSYNRACCVLKNGDIMVHQISSGYKITQHDSDFLTVNWRDHLVSNDCYGLATSEGLIGAGFWDSTVEVTAMGGVYVEVNDDNTIIYGNIPTSSKTFIQLDLDGTVYDTENNNDMFDYWNGSSWIEYPSAGLESNFGNQFRFTITKTESGSVRRIRGYSF